MYYLLVKTHKTTKLKYLCRHEGPKESCYTYLGSGKYWLRHLKKHGKDLVTEIVHEAESLNELKERGIFYSKLFNVVESDDWANLIPESGEGRALPHLEETKRKISYAISKNHPFLGKHHTKETKRRIGLIMKGKNAGSKHYLFGKKLSLETRKRMSLAKSGKNNPNYGRPRSIATKNKIRLALKKHK